MQPLGLVLADLDDSPAAVTIRSRRTPAEKLPRRRPEPWVAVETAPAICCATMSPWLASAEARRPERLAELADRRRRPDHDAASALGRVERMPARPREIEQQPVGRDDGRERVPRSGGAHRRPRSAAPATSGCDLVFAPRRGDLRRVTRLVSDPVRPRRHDEHLLDSRAAAQVTAVNLARVPLEITLFTDPACPFAFSAEPIRRRLRWHYGDQLVWRTRMIVLTLEPGEAERLAEGAPNLQRRFGMPIDPAPYARTASSEPACRAVVAATVARAGEGGARCFAGCASASCRTACSTTPS